MEKGRPSTVGTPRVSIRVLLPKDDYRRLKEIAAAERCDVGTLVRRAIARQFFIPGDSNTIKPQ
jgi:hypothetical protein